jgi:hypothetical protein
MEKGDPWLHRRILTLSEHDFRLTLTGLRTFPAPRWLGTRVGVHLSLRDHSAEFANRQGARDLAEVKRGMEEAASIER